MAPLTSRGRASLRASAFAYIDSKGHRRLPINDAAHVRNALARFDQVAFEDDTARERARHRLLTAAKKYGITPIRFFAGQLQRERQQAEIKARAADIARLPKGTVTFLLTDIEASTRLLRQLGESYAELLRDVRAIIRKHVHRLGGHEVDARGDEFFAAFQRPIRALDAALAIQRSLGNRVQPPSVEVRVRIGLHTGRPTLTEAGYLGIAVHTAVRVCAAGHGGQILLSSATRGALAPSQADTIAFRSLGRYRLIGLPEPEALFQVEAAGLPSDFPRLRARAARHR